jgi:hypothetical protein
MSARFVGIPTILPTAPQLRQVSDALRRRWAARCAPDGRSSRAPPCFGSPMFAPTLVVSACSGSIVALRQSQTADRPINGQWRRIRAVNMDPWRRPSRTEPALASK